MAASAAAICPNSACSCSLVASNRRADEEGASELASRDECDTALALWAFLLDGAALDEAAEVCAACPC